MRVVIRPALLVLAAALVAACGDHVGQAASGGVGHASRSPAPAAATAQPTAIPVPWTSTEPSFPPYVRPTVAPVPTGVARCDAHSLRIDPGGYQGAMGSLYGVVFLENTSTSPCLVQGAFTARFIARSGIVALVTDVNPMPSDQYAPLMPGWAIAGRVMIQWEARWCQTADPIIRIDLVYEGATFKADESPFVGGSGCDVPGAHAGHASVWPFGTQPTPPPPPVPSILRPTIDAPARVVAGTTLRYTVSLANTSSVDVQLDPCPNYLEWLGGRLVGTSTPPPDFPSSKPWIGDKSFVGVAKEGYALNCAGAVIAPGQAITFEMRLQIPADALGPDTLRWRLAGPAENQATFPLEIQNQAAAPLQIDAAR